MTRPGPIVINHSGAEVATRGVSTPWADTHQPLLPLGGGGDGEPENRLKKSSKNSSNVKKAMMRIMEEEEEEEGERSTSTRPPSHLSSPPTPLHPSRGFGGGAIRADACCLFIVYLYAGWMEWLQERAREREGGERGRGGGAGWAER